MALDDPYAQSYWDDDFMQRYRAAMAGGAMPLDAGVPIDAGPPVEQVTNTGGTINPIFGSVQPAPPPPPPEHHLGPLLGAPTQAEEVAQSPGLPPPPMPGDDTTQLPPPGGAPSPPVAAPAPLAVDATSGVNARPPDDSFTSTAPMPTERPEEELTPEQLGARYAALPPEQQEVIRGKIEGAKANFQATRLLDESERTRKQAEANARIYEESVKAANQRSVELDTEAKRIAAEDPADMIPLWKKVTGVIASVIGGLAQSSTGGRNVGLEAVQRTADEAAARHAQKLQLNARQQGAVGDQIQRSGDLYRAQEGVRLAVFDKAIGSLEAEVQQFDPRGTTALRVMDQLNQIKAKRQDLAIKAWTEDQKAVEAQLKAKHEADQLAETQRHNVAGEKADATRAYADVLRAKTDASKTKAEATVYSPGELQAMGGGEDAPLPDHAMTLGDYGKLVEARKGIQQVKNQSLETTNAIPGITIKDPKTGKEQPFVAKGTTESVEKLRLRTAAVKNIVALIDDARRTRTGWSTELGNSDEKQQLDAIWGQAKLAAKNYFDLGAITPSDVDLIKGALGTDNPSKLRNPVPGMEKARSVLINTFKKDLVAHGYPEDQPWDIKDVQKHAAIATPTDKELEGVLGTGKQFSTEGRKPQREDAIIGDPSLLAAQAPVAEPQQFALIGKWAGVAEHTQDSKVRAQMIDLLNSAATQSRLPAIRELAQQKLMQINAPAPSGEDLAPEVK